MAGVALLVVSATLVAITVWLPALDGAVYNPAEAIVPYWSFHRNRIDGPCHRGVGGSLHGRGELRPSAHRETHRRLVERDTDFW
jgi:hypothetical protein